jgi:hypothetical protein
LAGESVSTQISGAAVNGVSKLCVLIIGCFDTFAGFDRSFRDDFAMIKLITARTIIAPAVLKPILPA